MKNKEAIEELKSSKTESGCWDFMCGECPCDCDECELSQALDLAIKALEIVDSINAFLRKHNALDSMELMCIKDIINGEKQE